jgi:hypothetical protein
MYLCRPLYFPDADSRRFILQIAEETQVQYLS